MIGDMTVQEDGALRGMEEILEAAERRLSTSPFPEATYRLQLNRSFTFQDAQELAPYLSALGISHVYTSPYLKARPGSSHGYDIVDHGTLNPEIGSEEQYRRFTGELHTHGMGHILDMVPNHMGIASNENLWWLDVLENGQSSPYSIFFDIDWQPLKPDLANKVLLPILGNQFGKVLEAQELVLDFQEGEFFVRYYDRRLPISPCSAGAILSHGMEGLEKKIGTEDPNFLEYQSILAAITNLPARTEGDPQRLELRRRETKSIKKRLAALCRTSPEVREFIEENLREFNGRKGDSRSFDLLDRLLGNQPYRLADWRVAADEINYRRFFDINDLAGLCMENSRVFQETHSLIFRLIHEGCIDGLRIDHPDGLFHPTEYLWSLQRSRFLQLFDRDREGKTAPEEKLEALFHEKFRQNPRSHLARPLYVVVEKILEDEEQLPETWPIHGTTGYEFLNALNGLFVDPNGSKAFDSLYSRFIQKRLDLKDLVYRSKKLIMQVSMSSEINVLGYQLDRISEQNRWSRDFTLKALTDTIREVIACFPVYRTYISEGKLLDRDRKYVEGAVRMAKRKNPAMIAENFDFLRDILLLNYPENASEPEREAQRRFVGRFQQMTGPFMAKAVEDTTFYLYNRLLSLNEVGGDPGKFGLAVPEFHRRNLVRQARWPHSLLATSTHDTKRSEDVRARLNVLSEVPQMWRFRLFRWSRLNQRKKIKVDGEPCPGRNDEYMLYQTLLGTWPLEPFRDSERDGYTRRIKDYMIKAGREAKAHTSWVNPNQQYENGLCRFIDSLLGGASSRGFQQDFEPFARWIAIYGIWNSLSQTLLKLTCPGVPDIYQGTELWDFSLVDPDNRRPVNYSLREEMLKRLLEQAGAGGDSLLELARDLVSSPADGRIKLFVVTKVLQFRRNHPGLFSKGVYQPLEVKGAKREHAVAFVRSEGGNAIVVVAPRLLVQLTRGEAVPPAGPEIWEDTTIQVPEELGASFKNIFTGELADLEDQDGEKAVSLSRVLRTFPVALLVQ